eukprot:15438877-Alexandrium_andersonii.AAC.1
MHAAAADAWRASRGRCRPCGYLSACRQGARGHGRAAPRRERPGPSVAPGAGRATSRGMGRPACRLPPRQGQRARPAA